MNFSGLIAGSALALGLTVAGAASASGSIGQETANGFVGPLFPGTAYLVASDDENSFSAFGAPSDISDGLNFGGTGFTWTQDANSHWTDLGNQTWVVPASTSCGGENGNVCEFIGSFSSTTGWSPSAIGHWTILDPDGSVSDTIVTYNDINGNAHLNFFSDPAVAPEPASWALMLIGVAGVGYTLRRRSQRVAVV